MIKIELERQLIQQHVLFSDSDAQQKIKFKASALKGRDEFALVFFTGYMKWLDEKRTNTSDEFFLNDFKLRAFNDNAQ